MLERLQKILSARGICSRRKAEEYITAGLVKVNGKLATLGQKADPAVDRVEVEGKVMEERSTMLYYVMYKPVGVVTTNVSSFPRLFVGSNTRESEEVHSRTNEQTNNRANTPSVYDCLPAALRGKVYPVGRLDKDSEGLLLFTNDGVLAYRLTHPKFDHEKEYLVTVSNPITDGQLRKLHEGVKVFGEKTKPAITIRTGPSSFRITLTEGRNRQIRRMCQKVGLEVIRLERIRIGPLRDPLLRSGQVRVLTQAEIASLIAYTGIGT